MTRAMGTAERTAARRARFVSNSWSGGNFAGESRFNGDFNHRGHVIDFAAGDFGYGSSDHHFPFGVAYPTGLPFVTAVGGTTLVNSASRGRNWTETVWGTSNEAGDQGTNSGCTQFARPSWQKGVTRKLRHCRNRVENDVSANANPATGVAVYDSFQQPEGPWLQFGGTSEATPIITAMWALAGRPGAHAYPCPTCTSTSVTSTTCGSAATGRARSGGSATLSGASTARPVLARRTGSAACASNLTRSRRCRNIYFASVGK